MLELIPYFFRLKRGSDVTVEAKTLTANGTYSEAGKAYSPVTVAIPVYNGEVGQVYTVTITAENIMLSEPVPTTIYENGSVSFEYYSNAGYKAPATAVVTGAQYEILYNMLDDTWGKISLSNPTGNVSVHISGVVRE